MKPIETELTRILNQKFEPQELEVVNESDMHHGPLGRESHFKVYIVSDQFEGQSRIARQRLVFEALGPLMSQIHALALKAVTVTEHKQSHTQFESPQCASKRK